MIGNKLLKIIAKLDAWEARSFRQFLQSPYYNRRKDMLPMFNYCYEQLNTVGARIDDEELWRLINPDKKYNGQQLRLLFSYLYKLLEHWLGLREWEQQEELQSIYQMKAFKEKRLSDFFEQKAILNRKKYQRSGYATIPKIHEHHLVEQEYYDFIGSRKRTSENNLSEMTGLFDRYYVAGKLKHACLQLAHQTVYKLEYEKGLLDAVLLQIAAQPILLKEPLIEAYYYCYKATSGRGSFEEFNQINSWLKEKSHLVGKTELRDILLLAINFCIRVINQGNAAYISEIFKLYQTGLDKEILLEEGQLSPFNYRNIAVSGIKNEQFEWVENFIHSYESYLPSSQRKSTYNFCLAGLYYEQGRYEEAMSLLVNYASPDYLLTLGAKTTLIKIYYELDEIELLNALLASLSTFITRKKGLGYHKEVYRSLISAVRGMINLSKYDDKGKALLKEEVAGLKIKSFRDWMTKQLS